MGQLAFGFQDDKSTNLGALDEFVPLYG